jgi:hypothetical protein
VRGGHTRGGCEYPALLAVALAAAVFYPACAAAQTPATPAPTRPASVDFDIPAQPMAAALNAWAVQANAQVFVDPGPVAHLTAPAVRGTLTPRQALRALLARSNLQVTQGADGVFVIKPRPAIATVITPPPVAPQGTAAPVVAAPPTPLTARASAGPWLVGLGAEFSRDSAGATGGASAAFSGEYFITDQIAAALSATTPRGDSFSSALTLKYYFAPERRLDPFLGAGLDVTRLYGASAVAGLDRVMAGASVQAGLDVLLDAHWMINAGVSWAQVRIDRVQIGLGLVYRFGASGNF